MATASYFMVISRKHGTCALQDHFDLLTFDLDIMTTLKFVWSIDQLIYQYSYYYD